MGRVTAATAAAPPLDTDSSDDDDTVAGFKTDVNICEAASAVFRFGLVLDIFVEVFNLRRWSE